MIGGTYWHFLREATTPIDTDFLFVGIYGYMYIYIYIIDILIYWQTYIMARADGVLEFVSRSVFRA